MLVALYAIERDARWAKKNKILLNPKYTSKTTDVNVRKLTLSVPNTIREVEFLRKVADLCVKYDVRIIYE